MMSTYKSVGCTRRMLLVPMNHIAPGRASLSIERATGCDCCGQTGSSRRNRAAHLSKQKLPGQQQQQHWRVKNNYHRDEDERMWLIKIRLVDSSPVLQCQHVQINHRPACRIHSLAQMPSGDTRARYKGTLTQHWTHLEPERPRQWARVHGMSIGNINNHYKQL